MTWDGTTLTVNRTAFGSTQSVKPVQLLERAADFQLVREGRGWSAAFNAMPMKGLPDLKGFRDIQVLLGRPRQPVPVTDFADVLLVENGVALITAADLKSLRTFCGKYEVRDKDVEKYLRQVCRLDGRPRATASPLNKAAAAVRNRIDRAIREIGQESPPMAQHLDQSLKKGLVLSYRPPEVISWEL